MIVACTRNDKNISTLPLSDNTDSLVITRLIDQSKKKYHTNSDLNNIFDQYLKEAEEIAVKGDYKDPLCNIYIEAGKRYRNHSIFSKSYEYSKKALDIAIELENPKLISTCYNQIGVIYRRTGENTLAMDMHMKAKEYAEIAKDTFTISCALNGMGNVNLSMERYNAAIEYFNSSMNLSVLQNNLLGQAINYNNIGETYLLSKSYDQALEYFSKSLDCNTQINSKIGQSICYNSIGETYIEKGQPEKALKYLIKALHITREEGDLIYVAGSLLLVGKTYFLLTDYTNAEYFLNEGFNLSMQIGAKNQAAQAAELLAQLNENNGNYKNALEFYKTQYSIKDSLLSEKNLSNIKNIEASYESEQQKKKIEALNQRFEIQKEKLGIQKIILFVIVFSSILVFLILFLIVRQSQLREKYKSIMHQKRLLRSQMNPHFIFNALSAIQVFIMEHDIERSSRFLSEFAKLMRQVLRNSNYEYITLKEEIDALGYYIDLQNLRFSPPFEYSVIVDDTFDTSQIMIPPMLTQPFIENSIEHGLKPIGGNGMITLRFLKFKDQMIIEVEDNGIGIGKSSTMSNHRNHESMALKIVKERLDIIKRDTGKNVNFFIEDKQAIDPFSKGTMVRIEIPIIEKSLANKTNHEKD